MDLNTLHQVNYDPVAYKAFRESADRACGHELEAKKPEWFVVNILATNLIPGTEAPSVQTVLATVVIPNEYGEMRPAAGIDADLWIEMADAEEPFVSVYDRVSLIAVFNNNGTRVYTPPEEV